MADPLSLGASIIAVLGAADSVGKTLAKIRIFRNAPEEFLALLNEVSDLTIILNNVESYVIGIARRTVSPQAQLVHMSSLIERERLLLLQLEQVMTQRLSRSISSSGRGILSRSEWVRSKVDIERIRQDIREARINIMAQMVTVNSSVFPYTSKRG